MASTLNYISKKLSIFRNVSGILPKTSKNDVIWFLCIFSAVLLSVLVRLMPLNWSFTINEFDPYFNYDVTKHIVENGFASFFNWHTYKSWYPYGRDITFTSFPGIPFTGASLYYLVSALGFSVTVMDICIIFPVLTAALTCVVAYYFGKEIGGKGVGLLSALFLALNPAYIGRTILGFYDTETIGILGSLLAFLFYLRSIKPEKKLLESLSYAIVSGLSLGYVFASWGASRYPLSLLALFTFILLIIKRYSRRILISYGILMSIGFVFAISIPKLGINFLTEFEGVIAIGVFLLLLVQEISQHLKEIRKRVALTTVLLTIIGLIAIILWYRGLISLPIGKFMSVLNPFERVSIPLVESVQEHRPATWASFWYQFGILGILATLGIVFIFQKLTNERLFLTLFFLTTLYFSASMIRLTIIMSPALCILGAFTIVEFIKPFIDIAFQKPLTRRRLRISSRVGKEFSIILIASLFILNLYPLVKGIDSAYTPTTITSSSLPMRSTVGDWSEALSWMKENLPEDAVVASWWDYGYWITIGGDKISLADNGTINMTQIAQIGRMFMSNETQALTILKQYHTSYVVVFTTIGLASSGQLLYGDEVKWRWMAKIGGLNDTALEDTTITYQLAQAWSQNTQNEQLLQWYQQFSQFAIPKSNTVLTKLMIYGAFGYPSSPTHFQLVFSSSGWGGQTTPMVFVYKVLYT